MFLQTFRVTHHKTLTALVVMKMYAKLPGIYTVASHISALMF